LKELNRDPVLRGDKGDPAIIIQSQGVFGHRLHLKIRCSAVGGLVRPDPE